MNGKSFDGGLVYIKNEDGFYYVDSSWGELKTCPNDISDSYCGGSPSTSSHNDTGSILSNMREQNLVRERNCTSSRGDEAEELAWLDSLDASASTSSQISTNTAQPRDITPLALRLISLHSQANQNLDQPELNDVASAVEDDVD